MVFALPGPLDQPQTRPVFRCCVQSVVDHDAGQKDVDSREGNFRGVGDFSLVDDFGFEANQSSAIEKEPFLFVGKHAACPGMGFLQLAYELPT